jgi:hypothetical protein
VLPAITKELKLDDAWGGGEGVLSAGRGSRYHHKVYKKELEVNDLMVLWLAVNYFQIFALLSGGGVLGT